jgi:hypothetical protein
MMDKIIGVILNELRARRTQLSEAAASGAAKNYEDYRYMCGEIRGLTNVEMYLLDLAKNMEQLDDE